MSKKNTIAILHGAVPADAPADEQDLLEEVKAVTSALKRLGFQVEHVIFTLDIAKSLAQIRQINPYVVFNLVESVDGRNRWGHLAPSVLEVERIPYTGGNESAIYVTSNKILAKKLLRFNGIATPAWRRLDENVLTSHDLPPPLMVKPWGEDASQGIDDDSVCTSDSAFSERIRRIPVSERGEWIAETYIAGREFNISMLATEKGVEVMPPAEILFLEFPADKPAIVNYKAKWDESAFEYIHTPRTFEFPERDRLLLEQVQFAAVQSWKAFGCTGYARADLRVDELGQPWVIEINNNPCISPEAGFIAACAQNGLNYDNVIERIVDDAARRHFKHKGYHQ